MYFEQSILFVKKAIHPKKTSKEVGSSLLVQLSGQVKPLRLRIGKRY